MIKRLLLLVFILTYFTSPYFAANTSDLRKVEQKIKSNTAKIKPKIQERNRAEAYMSNLKKEIRQTELKLKKTKKRLQLVEAEEKKARLSVEKSSSTFQKLQSQFSKRIRQIFMTSPIDTVDVIFEDDFWSPDNENNYFIQKILKSDMSLIKSLQKKHIQLNKEKDFLEKKREDIARLKRDISSKESSLNRKKKGSNKLYF